MPARTEPPPSIHPAPYGSPLQLPTRFHPHQPSATRRERLRTELLCYDPITYQPRPEHTRNTPILSAAPLPPRNTPNPSSAPLPPPPQHDAEVAAALRAAESHGAAAAAGGGKRCSTEVDHAAVGEAMEKLAVTVTTN